MSLIGISGKKGSGKSTVARLLRNIIVEHEKKQIEVRAYADKMKDIVCMLIGCEQWQLEDPQFKETPLGENWRVYYKRTPMEHIVGEVPRQVFGTEEEARASYMTGNAVTEMMSDAIVTSHVLTPRSLLQLLGTEFGRRLVHPDLWINALFADYKDPQPNWIIADVRFENEAEAIKNRSGIVIRVDDQRTYGDTHDSETALDSYEFDTRILNNGSKKELNRAVKDLFHDQIKSYV